MDELTPVVVIAPPFKLSAWLIRFALMFAMAWVLMLLFPVWSPWTLGYWQVFALLATLDLLTSSRPNLSELRS